LLDRLYELNNPRRVTYEMVGKELAPDAEAAGRLRTLTRDLSRQFRGDKPIEARVVEVYLRLLFADDPMRQQAETEACLALHAFAFPPAQQSGDRPYLNLNLNANPSTGADTATSGESDAHHSRPAPDAPLVDDGPRLNREQAEATAAYIADLEHQLAEAQTRASLASALLVIARAEITRLRGKRGGFDWFRSAAGPPPLRRADGPATMPLRVLPYRGRPRLTATNAISAANAVPGRRGA
jgi:hypothetical protein